MSVSQVPRLKDVAKAANVSIGAASRILRGDCEEFGEETRHRVLEASRRLGWRRNLLVNGMQTGRTKTVGVLIPPNDSYWVNVLSGVHDALAESDFVPITVWIGGLNDKPHFEKSEDEGLKQINRLLDRRVDGLIMWPAFSVAYYHHFPEFIERRVPVAVIDQHSSVADSVETDEEQATMAVAKHLSDLGHRRIACISSRETASHTWAIKRRMSFESAVSKFRQAKVKTWHLNANASDGLEVARQLITDDFYPTAVFSVTDQVATFVMKAATELGRNVPRDLSIVGFADLDFAETMVPPLTTMRQKPHEVGRQAAKLIMDRISGALPNDQLQVTIKIPAELILRNSTAIPFQPARNENSAAKAATISGNGKGSDQNAIRVGHLREAAKHLHAAGLRAEAEDLIRRVEQMSIVSQ